MTEDFWNGFHKQAGLYSWVKSKLFKKKEEPAPEKKPAKYFYSKKFNPSFVKTINSSIRKNSRGGESTINLNYTKADGSKVQRKITPYTAKGSNVLVGYDHKRDAIRSFRMERIDRIS